MKFDVLRWTIASNITHQFDTIKYGKVAATNGCMRKV